MSRLLAKLLLILLFLGCATENQESAGITITGAGSSFPYPVVSRWAYKYSGISKLKVNYQSIGSAGGIAQVKARTVDFGITGVPLSTDRLKSSNLIQVPIIIGGVVPVINLPGIEPGELRLTGRILVDIYFGRIRRWNDRVIKDINPGIPLPDKEIFVVRRADGSGTTWIYTNYLYKVSEEWAKTIGFSKLPIWPENSNIAGKGNEGVSSYVQQIEGSLGYVEFSYALANKLIYVQMKNREGFYVSPGHNSFRAAAEHAQWDRKHEYPQLTNANGKDTWPITGTSFLLMSKEENAESAAVKSFYTWCIDFGAREALELHYVPVPETMARKAKQVIESSI